MENITCSFLTIPPSHIFYEYLENIPMDAHLLQEFCGIKFYIINSG